MKPFSRLFKVYGSAVLLSSIVLVMSCTDNFDEINTNKNALSQLGTGELPFLFSKAQSTATNNGWNYQIAQNLFHDQYCQYFANTTTYFPSDRLVIRFDWIRAAWNPIYSEVLPQLQTLLSETDGYADGTAENAIAKIWWVYTFHRLTDTWGPVPYTAAGVPNETGGIAYDDQESIYNDLFEKLDEAVTTLNGKTGETPYGSFDLIYGGNVDKWIRFANTLRLRLAIRVSGVEPGLATTQANAALAGNKLMENNSHDALITRTLKGDDFNGLTVMDWNEFRMSATMESVLKGYDDPRMAVYFSEAADGGYHGLRNGLTSADMANAKNKANFNSNKGPRWDKSKPGTMETASNVMAAAEAWFLKAEAEIILGIDVPGFTAEQLYNKGIEVSMNQWGISDAGAIAAYQASNATPIAPDDDKQSPAVSSAPVAFRSSGSTSEKLEQITIQKWLALFPEGVEAWADIRRSRQFKLYPVAQSDNPDLPNPADRNAPSNNWIRRIPFIADEKQTNAAEVEKAVNLLGGPDKITTPLWWDAND